MELKLFNRFLENIEQKVSFQKINAKADLPAMSHLIVI